MKRKTMMITAALTAVLVLALVAFAGAPLNPGYEAFKDVMRNQQSDFEKGAAVGTLTITDNGVEVINLAGQMVGDHANETMSGDLQIITSTLNKQLSVYGVEDVFTILDVENNDVYIATHEEGTRHGKMKDRERDTYESMTAKEEAIMDYFVGDLARAFKLVGDTDGSTDIRFELKKSEMPTLVNLLMSAHSDKDFDQTEKFQHDTDMIAYPLFNELKGLHVDMTELVSDVVVEEIQVTFDLNTQNQLVGLTLNATFSGLDANGQNHVITLAGQVAFDATNTQVVKPITLEGKTIYELPKEMNDEE